MVLNYLSIVSCFDSFNTAVYKWAHRAHEIKSTLDIMKNQSLKQAHGTL